MLTLLRDFLWWCGASVWRALRVMSGDDAFERHLILEPPSEGASPKPSREARRAIYDRELDRKWSRYTACGRCFER